MEAYRSWEKEPPLTQLTQMKPTFGARSPDVRLRSGSEDS